MRNMNALMRVRPTSLFSRVPRTPTHSRLACVGRNFSTCGPHHAQSRVSSGNGPNGSKPDQPDNSNPEYPAFSFEALGLSKNMKMVLIAILSVFGTIETWFWCKAIWRWWKGESSAEEK